jgi:hypothetical protein
MKLGLVGASYQEWSLPFDPQRTVNLIPIVHQMQQGKEVTALYATPGLSVFSEGGSGKSRGMLSAANGRAFAVIGSKLVEILANGDRIERGDLEQSNGQVTIVENGLQLAICDLFNVYILTYATNAYQKVTSAGFPENGLGTIDFIDNYFVGNENGTGKFYISALLDGLQWNALDFASAESNPDNLLRVFNGIGLLWLMGRDTTEIFSNTGDSVFPFERISGAQFNTGILSPLSVVEIDKSLFWVGREKGGVGSVYMTNGFRAEKISTPPIDQKIIRAGDFDNIVGYTYSEDGHKYYVINGGGLETTLVFDVSTRMWHERAFKNTDGSFSQHLAICHMYAFNRHLVGDRRNGNIYEMSMEFYDDAGEEILAERIFTNLTEENKRFPISRIVVDFEGGVGLPTGQGSNPVARLSISKDGGRTWGAEYETPIGKIGQTKTQVRWRRMGIAEQVTFRLRISDPVKRAITGAYAE